MHYGNFFRKATGIYGEPFPYQTRLTEEDCADASARLDEASHAGTFAVAGGKRTLSLKP